MYGAHIKAMSPTRAREKMYTSAMRGADMHILEMKHVIIDHVGPEAIGAK